ncbi:MAG TPA: 30S ribosomal protein S8 [Candidatus Saccharimonadales bacterium]|nr:30S ribosomal protein S8 [Candidatus Saccharimonadales bacterium]
MYNDTVSDFLTRLRNASMADKKTVTARSNKLVEEMAAVLKSEGFIASIDKNGTQLDIVLNTDMPFNHIKRLSKPGIRRYVKYQAIPRPKTGFGMVILTTPKGVLTGNQARKQKVGGELLCEVW